MDTLSGAGAGLEVWGSGKMATSEGGGAPGGGQRGVGARRWKVTCPHYGVWLLDGEGWQGLDEARYSIPEAL